MIDLGRGVTEGIDTAVGEHHLAQEFIVLHEVHARRHGLVDGELVHLEDDVLHVGLDGFQVGLGGDTGLDEFPAESEDAVLGLPGLHLLLGPVRGLVGRGMAAVAVGHDIQQARTFLLLEEGFLAAEGVDDRERIVAVHALCVPGLRIEAGAQAGRIGVTHGLAAGLAAHRVLVVHHVDEDRKATLHVALPQGIELVHRSEGHALQDRAAGHGAVTEVGDDDALLAVDFLVEGRAHGDGAGTAHDGVVRIDAEGGEERVHGSAQALVEAGRTGEDLRHRPVQEEADAEFLRRALEALSGDGERGTAPELLHHLLQVLLGENFDGTETLGEDFAMGTVAAEDEIVGGEVVSHAHGGGLLAGGQVGGTRVVVGDTIVAARRLDEVQHRLELPDDGHVTVDALEVIGREMPLGQLVLHGLAVLHHGDFRELDLVLLGAEHFIGVDI